MFMIGRVLGTACGVAASALWALAIWIPETGFESSGAGPVFLIVALTMLLLAIIAVIASVNGHAVVLLVVFFASFFPVGLMLLVAEDWLQWIGRVTLGFLLAGLLMWRRSRAASRTGGSNEAARADTNGTL